MSLKAVLEQGDNVYTRLPLSHHYYYYYHIKHMSTFMPLFEIFFHSIVFSLYSSDRDMEYSVMSKVILHDICVV